MAEVQTEPCREQKACRETIHTTLKRKAEHHENRARAYRVLLKQFADLSPLDEALVHELIGDAIWRDR